jgi:hypothetical protein
VWWRIYYEGGKVFTSADGSPFDAPRVGVLAIVQEKDGSWESVNGRDHFYWEPERGGWMTTEYFGAIDHLMRAPRQCLLFGRQVSDDEYRKTLERVHLDCGPRDHRYAREMR